MAFGQLCSCTLCTCGNQHWQTEGKSGRGVIGTSLCWGCWWSFSAAPAGDERGSRRSTMTVGDAVPSDDGAVVYLQVQVMWRPTEEVSSSTRTVGDVYHLMMVLLCICRYRSCGDRQRKCRARQGLLVMCTIWWWCCCISAGTGHVETDRGSIELDKDCWWCCATWWWCCCVSAGTGHVETNRGSIELDKDCWWCCATWWWCCCVSAGTNRWGMERRNVWSTTRTASCRWCCTTWWPSCWWCGCRRWRWKRRSAACWASRTLACCTARMLTTCWTSSTIW